MRVQLPRRYTNYTKIPNPLTGSLTVERLKTSLSRILPARDADLRVIACNAGDMGAIPILSIFILAYRAEGGQNEL